MNKPLIAIITLILVVGFAFHIYWEQKKQQYELQEHCGKLATTVWDKDYQGGGVRNTKDGQDILSYQNHYSPTLNKCFFLEITTMIGTAEKGGIGRMERLFDLNENKQYGDFYLSIGTTLQSCEVDRKTCHSEAEWKNLIKPYMGDAE